MYVYVLFVSLFLYSSSHDNCIVCAHMYVYNFSYPVNKLEIWWWLYAYTYLQFKKNHLEFCVSWEYDLMAYLSTVPLSLLH